jgi:hypothetical protein
LATGITGFTRSVRNHGRVTVVDRLADADLLWYYGRREGALLSVLVAVSATARRTFPQIKGERAAFEAFMKSTHGWTICVEHRGVTVDMDHLFYKWLRCELVHAGSLPPDVRIDDRFTDPASCGVRAGGAPNYTVLLSPGWYQFFVDAVRQAPANGDLHFHPPRPAKISGARRAKHRR